MKKIYDLPDLFSEQVKELYSAEKQQQSAFKKLFKKIGSEELQELNKKIIEKNELHIKRLEDVLEKLGEPKKIIECKAMKELIDRGLNLSKNCENIEVYEAGLVSVVQCMKHFEIADYGTLVAFADLLNQKEITEILKKSLVEEETHDKELTGLADRSINDRAKLLVVNVD